MAVIVLKRQTGRAHTADLLSSDTAEIPGKLVISGSALSGTEVLRVQGETQIDGTLHGLLNGTGLIIGVAGASASTGSALQIGSFTTTQRGNLASATGAAGMLIYNTTLTRFQFSNGTRWGDTASHNFQATVDPTTTDDSAAGYQQGSLWFNTTSKVLWHCNDATSSAAVWTIVTVLDTGGYLRTDLAIPNPNDPKVYTFGTVGLYTTNGSLAVNEVDYMRVWLSKGRVITKMRTFIVSGANGTRQMQFGIYDQSSPTSVTGTPNSKVASTAADTPPNATTGYRDVTLSASYTVPTSGFYWLAIQADNTGLKYAITTTYEAGFANRREETPGGFTLPTTAGTTTQPKSSLVYVAAVE